MEQPLDIRGMKIKIFCYLVIISHALQGHD